jgi:hypothetical protein
MIPVETVPGIEEKGMKATAEGVNDIFDTL